MYASDTTDMISLKTLLALKPNVLYPAHGPHIPGASAAQSHIQTYITHRQTRENQIIAILRRAAANPKSTITVMEELLRKYKADKDEAWKYKRQFLGRLKPDPILTEAEAATKTAEAKKAKEEEMRKLDVEGGVPALSLDNLVRLIYQTADEKTIYAAKMGTRAHLVKLEGEAKVIKRDGVVNPVLLDGEAREKEQVEGWEWAGPLEPERNEG